MRYAVETWDPAYGAASREVDDRASSRPVDVAVERPAERWEPVTVDPRVGPADEVTFVDGVRRIDARIWITDDEDQASPGVCATVGAGAVRCTPNKATIEAVLVRRGLYTASAHAEPIKDPGRIGAGVTYEVREVGADSDEAVYLGVHNHMTEIEYELSDDLEPDGLLVFDGPLGRRDRPASVGYIKSQHVHYVTDELRPVIGRLDDGQRTPLFHIGGDWSTWSWYLRLPGQRSHALSGIVRIELPGLGDAETAAEQADLVSATLPRFASEPHKDGRAPQNLYPIAGLERQLRRYLGDPKLLERALRQHAKANLAAAAIAG